MSGALDVFFALWFVFGNICLFGGYASPIGAPQIYKFCLIIIILSYIGYAMPLILCATICCFLPCIVNAIDSQDDQYQMRGASVESINALPIYKFKLKGNDDGQDFDLEALRKDSVCCVCLAEFEDGEEMRELPCSHIFHVECIDTWLKLNATCPLCKFEIGLSDRASPPTVHSNPTNS